MSDSHFNQSTAELSTSCNSDHLHRETTIAGRQETAIIAGAAVIIVIVKLATMHNIKSI